MRARSALLMMAPACLIYGLFTVYPVLRGLYYSFTRYGGVKAADWIGLANYVEMLGDPKAQNALANTAMFAVVVVVAQNGLALVLASMLYRAPAVRRFASFTLLMPAVLPLIIVGYIWLAIYNPLNGPLNAALRIVGLGSFEQTWLGNPSIALFAVAMVNVWMFTGYSMVIYLANYVTIPRAIFESCEVDGATGFRRWWRVDRYLLAPSMTVNIALSTIGTLKIFELPYVMTRGGPVNSTRTLTMVVYDDAFTTGRYGYGMAVAVVLLVFTVIVSAMQVSWLRYRESRI